MALSVVSLKTLIEKKGKDNAKQVLLDFACPLNKEVETFIHEKAVDFERIGLGRTYLIYANDAVGNLVLVALFTLGQGLVEFDFYLSRKERKYILGTTYPLGKKVHSLLIGQLAKNYKDNHNLLISGNELMDQIFLKIQEIHQKFPSVVTHIDCKDIPELRKYYEQNGFKLACQGENSLIYLLSTNDIEKLLVKSYE